jgi:hypothetical protein
MSVGLLKLNPPIVVFDLLGVKETATLDASLFSSMATDSFEAPNVAFKVMDEAAS